MVYLLKCGPFLKIGFTQGQTINHRLHQIRCANPYEVEVLAARPGTLEQEQDLHRGAKQWQHRGDWYNDCQDLRLYVDRFFFPETGDPNGVASFEGVSGPQGCSHTEQETVTGMFND